MESQQSVLERKLIRLIDQKFEHIYNNLGDGQRLLLSLDFRQPPKNEQVIQYDRTSGKFIFANKHTPVKIYNTHNKYLITDASGAQIELSEATHFTAGLMTAEDKQRLDNSAILTDNNNWTARQEFSSITVSAQNKSIYTISSEPSTTIDLNVANVFVLHLSTSITHLNILFPSEINDVEFSFILKVNQQNNHTITWPINFVWPNHVPYRDFEKNGTVLFEFTTFDRGNLWYCRKIFDPASLIFGFNDDSVMLSKNNEVFQLRS